MLGGVETNTNKPLSSVIALGAVCEIEDLNAPPRQPTLDGRGYIFNATSNEMNTSRNSGKWRRFLRNWGFYTTTSNELILKERQEALESGRPYFYVEEFADLDDGRRVILRDDRGWSFWPVNALDSQWKTAIGRELTKEAILILDPDDNEFWMKWVIERLWFLGIEVDPVSVHAAPFQIEFGPRVQNELRQHASG